MTEDHLNPEHQCVILADAERCVKEELLMLVAKGREKLEKAQSESQAVENALTELQDQTDNAKGLINETFQSYKSLLEKIRVSFSFQLLYRVHQTFQP